MSWQFSVIKNFFETAFSKVTEGVQAVRQGAKIDIKLRKTLIFTFTVICGFSVYATTFCLCLIRCIKNDKLFFRENNWCVFNCSESNSAYQLFVSVHVVDCEGCDIVPGLIIGTPCHLHFYLAMIDICGYGRWLEWTIEHRQCVDAVTNAAVCSCGSLFLIVSLFAACNLIYRQYIQ